jgi:hypothetical protein
MSRDEQLKERWNLVVKKLSNQFADGDILDLDAIIYLIGVQELGQLNKNYKKKSKARFNAYCHLQVANTLRLLRTRFCR